MRQTLVRPRRYGIYVVTGRRAYRGHEPGTQFEAVLDRQAETRAIGRGDIRLLKRVTPSIQPGTYTFPAGWLDDTPTTGAATEASPPLKGADA